MNYPTDLKDAEWELIEELFAAKSTGRPRKHSPRTILNAIFYVLKSGCQWRMLPKDFPSWKLVYWYFSIWTRSGLIEQMYKLLRKKHDYQWGRSLSLHC